MCRLSTLSNVRAPPFVQALIWVGLAFSSMNSSWAQAQPDPAQEFELPSFERQAAPAEAPSVPAPPPSASLRSPPQWPLLFGRLGLSVQSNAGARIGADGTLGVRFGTPQSIDASTQYRGWNIGVGVALHASKFDGEVCRGSRFCGNRLAIGPALSIGRAQGQRRKNEGLQIDTLWYAQVSPQFARAEVPDAPLSPGFRKSDLTLQIRAGAALGQWGKSRILNETFLLDAGVLFESALYSSLQRTLAFGVCLGVGF